MESPPLAMARKLDLAVSLYSGFSVSSVTVNRISRNEAEGTVSVAASPSQKRIAASRWESVRAMPRQSQRVELLTPVPRTARCTGDASARRRPFSSTSSTLAVGPVGVGVGVGVAVAVCISAAGREYACAIVPKTALSKTASASAIPNQPAHGASLVTKLRCPKALHSPLRGATSA